MISYQWAGNPVYTLTGSEVPPPQQAPSNAPNQPTEQLFTIPENLDQIRAKAETHTPCESISLRLPITKDAAVFTIEEIYWNMFAPSTLIVDAKNGEISRWEP